MCACNIQGPGPPPDEVCLNEGVVESPTNVLPSPTPSPPQTSSTTICCNQEISALRQSSLTNSTGSERESDSACVCGRSDSPNNDPMPNGNHDTFDWWFHRNHRGSHKSRYSK